MADLNTTISADASGMVDALASIDQDLQKVVASLQQMAGTASDAGKAMGAAGDKAAQTGKSMQAAGKSGTSAMAAWKSDLAPIGTAFDTLINAMITGTKNWHKTVLGAFEKMAEGFADNIAKMIGQWVMFGQITDKGPIGQGLGGLLPQTSGLAKLLGFSSDGGDAGKSTQAATVAAAQQAAADTMMTAATMQQAAADEMAASAAGGAGGFSPFGSDGIEGAFDMVSSIIPFDVGSWSVPGDMVARIHQGEMIIPAGPAQSMRDGATFSAGGPRALGGGDTHLHVHAMDARGVRQFLLDNHAAVGEALHRAWRNGGSSKR